MSKRFSFKATLICICLFLVLERAAQAQSDVTQPGDPIIASSSNSPGSEGVANAIDNTQAKYLNFDTRNPNKSAVGVRRFSFGRRHARHRHDHSVGQ
jgi:hypothetical protein